MAACRLLLIVRSLLLGRSSGGAGASTDEIVAFASAGSAFAAVASLLSMRGLSTAWPDALLTMTEAFGCCCCSFEGSVGLLEALGPMLLNGFAVAWPMRIASGWRGAVRGASTPAAGACVPKYCANCIGFLMVCCVSSSSTAALPSAVRKAISRAAGVDLRLLLPGLTLPAGLAAASVALMPLLTCTAGTTPPPMGLPGCPLLRNDPLALERVTLPALPCAPSAPTMSARRTLVTLCFDTWVVDTCRLPSGMPELGLKD
mmetsp:Transcript_8730/g.26446  ORF Transcript_8730/g.26446 Transcript_8730/m.26446 type:complete len:259 (-) Transcript_8730:245-1021(-)|eukprot:363625-Chlamydomonas_euryale.AAC.2